MRKTPSKTRINFHKHPEAKEKIKYLIDAGVMDYAKPDNPLKSISNFVLVNKSNMEGVRANSKADKQVAPNQGALSYRLTAGMKDLNKVLEGPTCISLPRDDEISIKITDCHCSVLDISDGFTSLVVSKDSQKYLNQYFEKEIIFYQCLIQGLSISPNLFSEAVKYTFSESAFKSILNKFG